MREEEFRAWLEERQWGDKSLTKEVKDDGVRRSLRAERGLKGLGFAADKLENLFDDGQWTALLDRLGQLKSNPDIDPEAVKSIVPQAEEPKGQLSNMIAALKQYGHFLEGRDPNYHTHAQEFEDEEDERDADRIRQYALEHYISPARAKGETSVEIRVGTLNNEMGLNQASPNICSALGSKKFQTLANVPPPHKTGPKQSTTTVLKFDLSNEAAVRPVWFVGASFGRKSDQMARFLKDGIWEPVYPLDACR